MGPVSSSAKRRSPTSTAVVEKNCTISRYLSGLSLTDFLQISVSVDADNETIVMTLKAAAGGEASNQSQGLVGLPNGRASLFNWTNFSAAPSGALGGIGTEVPEGVTLFQGELALLNIYRRALSADEIQELFDRTTLPDPGLITAFSASPQRIQSGDMVRLSWSVEPHETLTLKTPSGQIDLRDMDHLELMPTVSSAFTLIAEGPEGASARSVLVWVDIAEDAVILTESSDDWNQPGAWADGQSPSSAKDYVVTDFMASSLGVQDNFDARFGGGSLELMGMGSRLRIANDLTDQITIPRFKLSGGTVDYTAEEGSVTVEGSWEVLRESLIDIRGTYNAMYLNASISGDADLRFWANPTDLASDETLILTGDLSGWRGGLILEGGRTYADASGGLAMGTCCSSTPTWKSTKPSTTRKARWSCARTATSSLCPSHHARTEHPSVRWFGHRHSGRHVMSHLDHHCRRSWNRSASDRFDGRRRTDPARDHWTTDSRQCFYGPGPLEISIQLE